MKLPHALLLGLSLIALPLHAADVNDLKWTMADGEVAITDCDPEATGELVIPDTIGGNPVTAISNEAFADCGGLSRIVMNDSIASIGYRAFYRCKGLVSIHFAKNLTSIGNSAFFECKNLTRVKIPDGVRNIPRFTFSQCSNLTNAVIGRSVDVISEFAFLDCRSLESIVFSGNAPSVLLGAFNGVEGGRVFITSKATGFVERFEGFPVIILDEPVDSDGDGVPDVVDAFPNDPAETVDSDGDGVGDNADVFPNDPMEVADCDNDGVGDNADARSGEQITELQARIAQLQEQLSQRPTLEEIVDARAGSVMLVADREKNEVTLRFKVEETDSLKQGTWSPVQGGDISLKVPLEQGNKFLRIALGE